MDLFLGSDIFLSLSLSHTQCDTCVGLLRLLWYHSVCLLGLEVALCNVCACVLFIGVDGGEFNVYSKKVCTSAPIYILSALSLAAAGKRLYINEIIKLTQDTQKKINDLHNSFAVFISFI